MNPLIQFLLCGVAVLACSFSGCSAEAQPVPECQRTSSTSTSCDWAPARTSPPDAGTGPSCDEGKQDPDAGAPDVPAQNEAVYDTVSGSMVLPYFHTLEPWSYPTVKIVQWHSERCDTCYVPCGFGPKGCMKPVTCCGKHIIGEPEEMRDP